MIQLPMTPELTAGGFQGQMLSGLPAAAQQAIAAALAEADGILKAEGAAYPTFGAHVGGAGGAPVLSPLQTQSIQGTLDDASFRMKHLTFWRLLQKVVVSKSTTHEAVRINVKGSDALDPHMVEGGLGAFSTAEFEKILVNLKFLGEPIEVADTSAVIAGGLDGGATLLETRTRVGLEQLLARLERWSIEGDATVSALQFNGLRAAITQGAPDNVFDLEGDLPSGQYLEDVVGFLQDEPNFAGELTGITAPRTHRALAAADVVAGRYPKDRGGDGTKTYIGGPKEVFLTSDYGDVPLLKMPLIHMPPTALNLAAVGAGAPAAVAIGNVVNGGVTGSRFRTKDIGVYDYRFVPVGDKGAGAAIAQNDVTIAAVGDAPTFTITDDAITDAANTNGMIRYYRVFRTEKNDDKFDYIGQFARDPAGNAVQTTWTDKNFRRPFRRPIFIGQFDAETVYWAQLMDIVRRPLAQVQTTIPFLIYLMGALFVKQPRKWALIDNAAIKA